MLYGTKMFTVKMTKFFITIVLLVGVSCNPTIPPPNPTTPWWEELENLPAVVESEPVDQTDLGTNQDLSDFSRNTENSAVAVRISGCGGSGTECIPYYQCNEGNIITDGKGLIDIRFRDTVIRQHSRCQRYLDVCCKKPNSTVVTTTTTYQPHVPTCGSLNPEGVHARITGINDTQTQFGEFPWQVAILRIETIGGKEVNLYLCGGSLIEPNVVLTAAHCVRGYGSESLKIRAGEWDTQSEYEIYPHQDRFVNESFIHPDYNGGSLWNDFAVLILKTPFTLAPHIDTICLPEPNESFKGVSCIATGWGKDKFGAEGRFQNVLKQVSLTVIHHGVCENALKSTRLGPYFVLDQSFLCAGGMKEIDTCKGDGGSPLVCLRSNIASEYPVYYQAGIVAWGIGCGENGIPGVYADVSKGVNWIKEVIAANA